MLNHSGYSIKSEDSNFHFGLLFIKGLAMGLSDSVPGISGGTIAVITNIYDRLIFALRSIDGEAFRLIFSGKLNRVWKNIDGNFLLILGLGVLAGIFLSANTILFLFNKYPEPLLGFFVGLVLMSAWILKAQFDLRKIKNWLAFVCGLLVIFTLGNIDAKVMEVRYTYIFFSGMIGIFAMILPGLSGAFILILLGVYEFLLTALVELNFPYVGIFVLGCLTGLGIFSRILAFLLKHYYEVTYSLIVGMMVASVDMLWPWQRFVVGYAEKDGIDAILQKVNVLPLNYTDLTGNPMMMPQVLFALTLGVVIVRVLNKVFDRK